MSVKQNLTDPYTTCANHLVGAFHADACSGDSLQNKGYKGIVDPVFNGPNGEMISDFISFGVDDIQHYKIVGARPKVNAFPPTVQDKDEIRTQLDEVANLNSLDATIVSDFLTKRGESITPAVQESVAIIPEAAYSKFESLIEDYCEDYDIIVWAVTTEDNWVRKVGGRHSTSTLDERLSSRGNSHGIKLHEIDSTIYPVVRNSDMKLIKFRFIQRLITYAYHEQTRLIPYADIDKIMLSDLPALLGHLPEDERDKNWQQCMLTLRNTLGLVKDSQEGIDIFEWKKERFLYDRSARSSLIENARSGLGIGVDA